ncbi:MAG: flavodoxin [Lachnospiraceae bacterium]|nr:flavodoxin [Lachnospiraceae bacterium]
MKKLVLYFSAEGNTAKVGKEFAERIGAEVFEIVPEVPYTKADIRWMNPLARCNKEKFGKKDVPVKGKVADFDAYDTVYIGFPIWYGCAPNVVNTFCAAYDWTGKKIGVFATSGGSGIGKTAEKLAPYVKGGEIVSAKLVKSSAEVEEIS